MNISVIICCYNSETRIGPTLQSIAKQVLTSEVSVEVILVDNNCSDQTVAVAEATWGHETWPLKVVKVPVPGLSAARDGGCREASGEFLLFCDDDNWLNDHYLAIAYNFMIEHINYAAIGGWSEVATDVEVPAWFHSFETKYACGKTRGEGPVDTLVGAGLFLRKQAMVELRESGFVSTLSDRKGAALSSGGDLELCMALRLSGWKLHFSEKLYFKHFMPAGRLTEDYLIRMCEGHGRSRSILGEYRSALAGSAAKSPWLYGIGFRFRLFLRFLKFRVRGLKLNAGTPLVQRVEHATNTGSAKSDSECLISGKAGGVAEHLWRSFECLRALRDHKS
jgi:glycosyltransferase involved in cell wall biosynthesis